MVDSHCHLDFPDYQSDFKAVAERTRQALDFIINVGTDVKSSERVADLSQIYDFMYAAIGVHPHDASSLTPAALDRLSTLTQLERVVAVGECGLDYARLTPGAEQEEKRVQQSAFISQINLARQQQLPLVIHCRQAYEDLLTILDEYSDLRGVIHCYLGNIAIAERLIDKGFYISFTGIITFKNAPSDLLDTVKQLPLERLLIETDAPFLAPEPYRGQRNEPAWVVEIARKIAQLKSVDLTEVDKITTANAKSLFGIS